MHADSWRENELFPYNNRSDLFFRPFIDSLNERNNASKPWFFFIHVKLKVQVRWYLL